MKILLHSCCAPCSLMCIESLRGEGHQLTSFWYNPNIHPFTEYRSRRNCLTEYAKTIDLPVILKDEYALRPFVRAVAADIAGRCGYCYAERMSKAAAAAKENGFDAFTTSLLISPYQDHDRIIETAKRCADAFEIEFLYRDFRPMFKEGQARARELGFYMQKYCGCVFSEEERYLKEKKRIP